MAQEYVAREPIIEHPNRDKSSSKTMRVIVVIMLLISAALVLVITIGGWEVLQGLTISMQRPFRLIRIGMTFAHTDPPAYLV